MSQAKRTRLAPPNKNVDPNAFTFLVATDLHVGYGERDPVRKDDSFRTFEEVLQLAVYENVDFILCGKLRVPRSPPCAQVAICSTRTNRRECVNTGSPNYCESTVWAMCCNVPATRERNSSSSVTRS
jgi:hypothetical protein